MRSLTPGRAPAKPALVVASVFASMLVSMLASVQAADPCCVDEDVAAAFLPHITYSREWPAAFPLHIENPGLVFIASSIGYQGKSTAVAWRSEMDVTQVLEAAEEALRADDWLAMPGDFSQRAFFERGFIPYGARKVRSNQQYCRQRDGMMLLAASPTAVGTVLTMTHHRNHSGQDCAEQIATLSIRPDFYGGLMNYLPALQLPRSVEAAPGEGAGSGGGGDEAHTSIVVKTAMSAAELIGQFESQMTGQQWLLDSRFEGSLGAGHLWRRDADGLSLYCIVTAIETGERLRLRMHLEPF